MAIPKSHSQSVLPSPRFLVLESIEQFEDQFLLSVHVEQDPCCPECGQVSSSRHSSYVRRLQDHRICRGKGSPSRFSCAFGASVAETAAVRAKCSPNELRAFLLIFARRVG